MNQKLRQIALKVDVNTWRGVAYGVPRLVELLKRYGADATFLFALGPDNSGRAVRRIFHSGMLAQVFRTSVLSHYGLRTALLGTLLPAPVIASQCARTLTNVQEHGFEVGVHGWDRINWEDRAATADNNWIETEMHQAADAFTRVFGEAPRVHGAPGWQMNRHALRLTQRLGYEYSSDARGVRPFWPIWQGEPVACLQFPTTLPTLDELIGINGITAKNISGHLLLYTIDPPWHGHVYTLRAEVEGMKSINILEQLILGWQDQGYRLVSLRTLNEHTDREHAPRCELGVGSLPGRVGNLMVQAKVFAEASSPNKQMKESGQAVQMDANAA